MPGTRAVVASFVCARMIHTVELIDTKNHSSTASFTDVVLTTLAICRPGLNEVDLSGWRGFCAIVTAGTAGMGLAPILTRRSSDQIDNGTSSSKSASAFVFRTGHPAATSRTEFRLTSPFVIVRPQILVLAAHWERGCLPVTQRSPRPRSRTDCDGRWSYS